MLPKSFHNEYIAAEGTGGTANVASIADGITRLALEKGKAEAEGKVPEIIREKQLRIRKKGPSITPVGSNTSSSTVPKPNMSYSTIAAEYFIIPLIDKFWEYLRDEQTRETRTQHSGGVRYRGAGTGMILDSLTLQHFLTSLAVIVHAARHSNAFLRIITPNTLEVAVTLGSKPVSSATSSEEDDRNQAEKENSVLAASLELALVIIDAAYDLDEGRTLALESTALLSSTREWASSIFLRLDAQGGVMISRESSDSVNRLRRATAGVVLKIEEMLDKWRRVMVDL
jgi:telomere length regulation protein